VTNVPGPQFPLYTLGARLVAMYPQVPLLDNMGLGIALFSYDGQMCWGFNADFELVPDLPAFKQAIQASFERLCDAAGVGPKQEAPKSSNGEAARSSASGEVPAATPLSAKPVS